jgi:predicted ATPase
VGIPIEDLHWADPTTLDVLRSVAGPATRTPLFIVTTRPEFRPPLDMRSHHATRLYLREQRGECRVDRLKPGLDGLREGL